MLLLNASERTTNSSAEAKRLRKSGLMPMALITPDKETQMIQANTRDIRDLMKKIEGVPLFSVQVEGAKEPVNVVLKGIQRDDITQAVTHLTVQQVRDEDRVRVSIPLVFEGTPVVVTKGDATIVTNMNKLEVEGVVKNLPSILKIQIGHMASNERILVGDLELPEGVSALAPAAAPVVSTAGRRR